MFGPVEAGDELARLFQRQALDDLAPGRGVRRGGERDARHCRKTLVEYRQFPVFGAEVVAPLRHAVRLVDGEQRQSRAGLHLLQRAQEIRHQQALRGHIEDVQVAAHQAAKHVAGGVGVQAGVEEGGLHAELLEGVHLVLHQRDQRRHHDADALPQQRGELVAQGFSAAGRHQHQRVATRRDMLDDGLLFVAEGRVAENVVEDLLGGGGGHGRSSG